MQSKTSFFNPTLFRKNMTRFAPAWGLYTLCLVLGVLLIYNNGGEMRRYWMATNLSEMVNYLSLINLIYAPLVAQLLFGDLYSSRMCNALHALPLRRECFFVTNAASGLVFSLLPTAVMTLVCLPLLSGSMVVNAWQIALLVFLGGNLSYLCFFGISVFCALCVGNRLTMVLLYCLMNFGAYILFWLVDTVYTPMLFGVNTPTMLVENLTPYARITEDRYIEIETLSVLHQTLGEDLSGVTTGFVLTDAWGDLAVYALGGAGLLIPALLLYRVRDLECAGDAVAFRLLEPLCLVLAGVVGAAGFQFILEDMLGVARLNYGIMAVGLFTGWFAAKMLIERTTRVFRPKNWAGMLALTAALALSLVATHVDIFGIETRIPDGEDVASVTIYTPYSGYTPEYEDPQAIEDVRFIHAAALADRLERSGAYITENGAPVYYFQSEYYKAHQEEDNHGLTLRAEREVRPRYATKLVLDYRLKNGTTMSRSYVIWVDSEAGQRLHPYLSTWEANGGDHSYLQHVLANLKHIEFDGMESYAVDPVTPVDATYKMGQELMAAMKADCEAGLMAAHPYYHHAYFSLPDVNGGTRTTKGLYLYLEGGGHTWGLEVYADCENTVQWLRKYMPCDFQILEVNAP